MTTHETIETENQENTSQGPALWSVAVVGVALCITLAPFLHSAWLAIEQGTRDSFALYRASVAQRHLEEFNKRLKAQLNVAQNQQTQRGALEQEVARKLDTLESVVEGATHLGFLKRGRDLGGEVMAKENGGSSSRLSGKLAGLLEHPSLSKKSRGSRKRANVGGAEKPCKEPLCQFGVEKKDVSMVSPAQVTAQSAAPKSDVMKRLEHAIAVMRILPIGSPVDGDVSSGFGYRRSPFSRRSSFHEGIDLSLSSGGRVAVTGAGVVQRVAFNRTYGLVIDVEHAPGLVTRYAHLKQSLVRPGQQVARGDLIARSGSSGRSTGPHLHYEVLYRNQPKNPKPFIDLADELDKARLNG